MRHRFFSPFIVTSSFICASLAPPFQHHRCVMMHSQLLLTRFVLNYKWKDGIYEFIVIGVISLKAKYFFFHQQWRPNELGKNKLVIEGENFLNKKNQKQSQEWMMCASHIVTQICSLELRLLLV